MSAEESLAEKQVVIVYFLLRKMYADVKTECCTCMRCDSYCKYGTRSRYCVYFDLKMSCLFGLARSITDYTDHKIERLAYNYSHVMYMLAVHIAAAVDE